MMATIESCYELLHQIAHVDGEAVGIPKHIQDRIYDSLEAECKQVVRPVVSKTDTHAELTWVLPKASVKIAFSLTDDTWDVYAWDVDKRGLACTRHYSGSETFVTSRGEKFYVIPSEVANFIFVDDEFDTKVDLIQPYEYRVVWITSKYDGMLSGYCYYDRNLCYFDMVEETPMQRKRLFAIYKLSVLKRLMVWKRYHMWHFSLAHNVVFNIRTWFWRRRIKKASLKDGVNTNQHGTPIAYFQN
jgi:hypothetical protein